jgi:hypothetical protein
VEFRQLEALAVRLAVPTASGHLRQVVRPPKARRLAVHLEEVSHLDGRAPESVRREQAWRPAPASHQERASEIRLEAHQDGRAAGCRGPASQSALGWPSAQASGGPSVPQVQVRALRWAPVTVRPVPEVAAEVWVSRAWLAAAAVEELASVSLLVQRAPAVLPQAGAASAHAAAAPRPEAATAASGRQAAAVVESVPDASRVAAVAASDVPAREAAVAGTVRAEAPPWVAVRSDARVLPAAALRAAAAGLQAWLPAAVPSAAPSAAASVFRQGRLRPVAEPARQRSARIAHAMLSLRMASR